MTGSPFVDMMLSGAFIFSADKDHKLLYTNEQLVRFFECEDTADLMKYVGGSFDGMIHDPEPEMINKEIESQLGGSSSGSGYVFFNIINDCVIGCFCRNISSICFFQYHNKKR